MRLLTTSFLFLIISFSVNYLQAQLPDYLTENTEWSENILFKEDICINQYKTIYYLNGDSTAGSQNYKKLYRRGLKHRFPQQGTPGAAVAWCAAPVEYFNEFSVLIRQEQQKLYVYHPEYGDTLLYDFDLQPGDTVPSTINDFNVQVVDHIDSVALGNGYRKAFHFTDDPESMTEGVGSEAGLMQFFNFETNSEYFYFAFQYCYRNDHGNLSFSSTTEYCNWTMDISEQSLLDLKLNVFPNPATNSVQLTSDFSLDEIQQIEIINVLGEKFPVTFYKSDSSIKVSLETLPAGLYLIRLKLESGWSSAVRVMKE